MKKTKKLICLLLLVVIIATALCTVLTACGEKSELKLILGATEKSKNYLSFNATKGTTYTVDVSGVNGGDGSHLLEVNLTPKNKKDTNVTATIQVQQTDWNLIKAWNSTDKLTFNKGTSSKKFTIGASKLNQDDIQLVANRCRLLVTVNTNATIGIELYENLDVKENIKIGANTYYTWKSSVQPVGIRDGLSYRTIVYLGENAAIEFGKVLKNEKGYKAVEHFLTTNESKEIKLKNLSKAISDITKGVAGFSASDIATLIGNSLLTIFKWGYSYREFNKELQSVANTLSNAKGKGPQCVAFSVVLPGSLREGYYHIDANDWMFKTQNTYTLMGAQRHSGAFYNSAGKKI